MSEVLLLYLFTRLDSLHGLLAFGIFFCLVGGIVGLIASRELLHKWSWESKEQQENDARAAPLFAKWGRRALFAVPVMAIVLAISPSSKDLAIIVGGKIAIDVARSEPVSETAGKAIELLRAKIDAELQATKKRATE